MVEKSDFEGNTGHEFHDPDRQGVHASVLLPVIIMQEHPNASSRFRVEVLVTAAVLQLKVDFQGMLNVTAENQDWSFKNRKLSDNDTIQMIGMKKDDIIFCKTHEVEGTSCRLIEAEYE